MPIQWPRKTREVRNQYSDSRVWNGCRFRDDDIIIASYAKSGTTWLQQIVGQLVFNGEEGVPVADLSPWLDFRIHNSDEVLAKLEEQQHRRFLKTHLPVDALVFSPDAKYLYIARDGRDIVWSMYNHHASANALYYQALNETPGRVGPPIEPPPDSVVQYFQDWMEKDGFPFWPFWENVRSWWQIRTLPNVMLIHFSALQADMPAQIREIAAFLDVAIDETAWDAIVEHCSFRYMKTNAGASVPMRGALWKGGAETFLHRGTNGRWRTSLSAEDIETYEATARAELGPECAAWLATGRLVQADDLP